MHSCVPSDSHKFQKKSSYWLILTVARRVASTHGGHASFPQHNQQLTCWVDRGDHMLSSIRMEVNYHYMAVSYRAPLRTPAALSRGSSGSLTKLFFEAVESSPN